MAPLVLVGLSILLFVGFLLLTRYEVAHGMRLLATRRMAFDARATHLTFALTHIDFESFLREQVHILSARIAHDIAHLSLITVRVVERLLTRLVKHLRARHGIVAASTATPRAFVKTMSDFKQQLASTRPPLPELH
ncbi:MAG: hypothetical protein Q7R54_01865 [bacterium]|nr:hypothetical protein [bacterium]